MIAYGMHTGAGPADRRTTPAAEATFHEVERWLHQYRSKRYSERSEASVFDTRENLLSQSGLFVGMAEGRAGFAHLSFQEFFAAQRAFTVNDERLPEVFLERAQTAEWRNTLSFLFGRLLSAFSEPKKALDLLQAQIETVSGSDTGQLLVLADAAQVLTCKGITVPSECHSRLKDLLLTAMRGPADVTTRAAAGSALGWLGDPRFREDRLWLPDEDLLGFIRVAPGAFLMGSDPRLAQQAKDNERPQHAVELPGYYIGRHPVTVAQFQAFVDDSAFGVSEAYPRPWAESLRTIPNHAIVSVTFQDARRMQLVHRRSEESRVDTPSPPRAPREGLDCQAAERSRVGEGGARCGGGDRRMV